MKVRISLLGVIWAAWAIDLFILLNYDVKEASIEQHFGVVEKAACITSRSVNGLKLLISYDINSSAEEFFNLPGRYQCEDLLIESFPGKQVAFSKYKNRYVSLIIGDIEILEVGDGIKRANNTRRSIFFSLSLALLASAVIIIKKRNINPRKNL
ncbi:hypothetical protein [Halopseudomonas salegens]|uniref:hypothetical protein n=1 Tax=Halopseudomonas salegens TaxID=1434072 RepID=UPI000B898495|nr:hypothetical protein [Halopseudomonas salegens]